MKVLCSVCLVVLFAGPAPAEIIDRVLAVVEGQLILLSDVAAARDLGLVPIQRGTDPIRETLSRLIDRALILSEVDRFPPSEPDTAEAERRLEDVRARFPSAGAFDAALARAGIDHGRLRAILRQNLRIKAYLTQRFTTAAAVNDDELTQFYRTNPSDFTRNGVLVPFDQAREDVARVLATARRNALVADWVAGLRRRAEFIDLSQER